MLTLPGAGSAVVLRDRHGGEYRSTVVTLTDKAICILPPIDLTEIELGTRLLVVWPDEHSQWVLPVVVTALDLVTITPEDVYHGMWEVRISDDPWREDRRRHIRQPLDASLDVAYDVDGEVVHADAILVDLSEAALRCAVARSHQLLRVRKTPVRLSLAMGGDAFLLPATVLSGRPAAREDLRLELVVLFDRPVDGLDRLRMHLV